jgi:uncharacterized SAM-binding protein YcdF (DUF218 family)
VLPTLEREVTAPLRESIERFLADAKALWDFHIVYDEPLASDVIVCLGSYDLRVAVRCAQLLQAGTSTTAVITGGYGNWTRGKFEKPEADVFADVIEEQGVSKDRLIIESKATNIGQNVDFSRLALRDRAIRTVTFVTKPQTQRRVYATVRRRWPEIEFAVTAPQADLFSQAIDAVRLMGLIDEMVGDLQRMVEYPAAGFQVPVEIPNGVLDAYQRLRAAGFDRHCRQ